MKMRVRRETGWSEFLEETEGQEIDPQWTVGLTWEVTLLHDSGGKAAEVVLVVEDLYITLLNSKS